MTDDAEQKREKVRQTLRETFGETLDHDAAAKIADKVMRPKPVLHQRKPLPR